jgi:hypothetical protein
MVAASAVFVKLDTTTLGNWPGVYGAEGFDIYGTSQTIPAYSKADPAVQIAYLHVPQASVWASTTVDPRALPVSATPGAARFAGLLWASDFLTINLKVTDGGTHKVAVYALDWNNYGYQATYSILDHATQAVLDSRTLSGLRDGKWVQWAISGDVDLKVAPVGSSTASVSALFFDPSAAVPTTITLTSSVNPAVVGQQVKFTATVVPVTGTVAPTGTVTFYNGTTVIGTGTLS